ncbi:hypothetical protein CPAST_c39650 [Clostridium pasteurianum DSM 525 = ATCC 6013]|uniref:Uncharacterized protein n=1 Tax=Clostridium pasteurianum DSM 525 = ATCC 6013 TaxID=1262449 RepID=A0A0H3JAZ0_CLOPA|nr:hypothetical protein [Clostridium pasteurianum]AJA50003.1 hypothetical protein CPAST_c39650 [Clostridium pasteurianum DSM 525 = ATCC 6013]AJA53991.1 hypothetical protein CLPA_c39650 [Clostridium pasteurianum DSM 525 = ATCC 6013]AOZ77134.1 hypothetical protein AQ983_19280 [Clostridium pasteurianum DSM 525 = ATCC 6013]AOZ80931.1 hypothetical protein AQ984_19275 [Clostridium pasteurianum]ELP59287.1 hypothetical protein F502_10438 [Clostridium pasteurianum DSM 525 = ATCC 6013]
MPCPNMQLCPFINNTNDKNENFQKDIIKYKEEFCNNNYKKCARFILGNVTGEVPDDLAPDNIKTAEKLMKR